MAVSNKDAMEHFIRMPVSMEMVHYLAKEASQVLRCSDAPSNQDKDLPPTPPDTPPSGAGSTAYDSTLPTLDEFIVALVRQSHVQVPTLMTTLVYLARLKSRLPPAARGMKCSAHRIFLAALILAAKNLNDSSPKNKHWARYTSVEGWPHFRFSNTEVNLMERQLLALLDFDLRVTEDDLYENLEYFLSPIRSLLSAQKEQRERQARQARERRAYFQEHVSYGAARTISHSKSQANLYDSPRQESLASHAASRAQVARRFQPSGSSSRLPLRTPSLSPPSRTSSAASYEPSLSSRSPSPSLERMQGVEHVQIATYDQPCVVEIQPPQAAAIHSTASTLPYEIAHESDYQVTSKKMKPSGNIFTRLLPHMYGRAGTTQPAMS